MSVEAYAVCASVVLRSALCFSSLDYLEISPHTPVTHQRTTSSRCHHRTGFYCPLARLHIHRSYAGHSSLCHNRQDFITLEVARFWHTFLVLTPLRCFHQTDDKVGIERIVVCSVNCQHGHSVRGFIWRYFPKTFFLQSTLSTIDWKGWSSSMWSDTFVFLTVPWIFSRNTETVFFHFPETCWGVCERSTWYLVMWEYTSDIWSLTAPAL